MPSLSGSVAPSRGDLTIVWREDLLRSPPLVLPGVNDGPVARLVARLLVHAASEAHMLMLRPPAGGDAAAWHADAWHALPAIVRDGLVAVAGPTAFVMEPLVRPARPVLVTTAPADIAIPAPGLIARMLEKSAETPDPRLAACVNLQAKLLLGPDEHLDFGYGSAQSGRWMHRMSRRIDVAPVERLEASAAELSLRLDCDPDRAREEAALVRDELRGGALFSHLDDAARDRWLRLNWLDAALWDAALRAGTDKPSPMRNEGLRP